MRQKVIKISKGQFRVFWDEKQYADQALRLDFNALIHHFKLTGNYCLLHWQARPKGLRRWGIYDAVSDQYFGLDYDAVQIKSCSVKLLQMDETKLQFPPSAVLWLEGQLHYRGEHDVTVGD